MLTTNEIGQLDRLALGTSASHVAASAAGLRHARSRGYGLETTDHRPYRAGDDPRLIDWNIEARLRQLAVRVLSAAGQARVHVVLDVSASMRDALPTAARVAAALLYLATARRDLGGLSLVNDAVVTHLPPAGGRAALARVLPILSSAAAEGRSDLDGVLARLAHQMAPPAFVVVLSDFFVPGFGLGGLRALSERGLDPAAVQVIGKDVLSPEFPDGTRLSDLETGGDLPADVAAYQTRIAAMTADLASHCAAHGMPWLQLVTSTPFDRTLDALIRAGIVSSRRA